MADSYFRGMRAIEEVLERLKPLAEWTKQFKPEQRHIVLQKKDFDVIERWPKAARVVGFHVGEHGVYYQNLRLYPDHGRGRYVKPQAPEQAVIQ